MNMEKISKEMQRIMKQKKREPIALERRDEFLDIIDEIDLSIIIISNLDRLFCNIFLNESVRLLKNAIILYEEGFFDCAFYSIRQAAETCNSMLYLANAGEEELNKWKRKEHFFQNKVLLKKLVNVDAFYADIKKAIPAFFEKYNELQAKSNKIIHKQGFDTFYTGRIAGIMDPNEEREEKELFEEYFVQTACLITLVVAAADPICLVISDEDLDMRFNFDVMERPINAELLEKYIAPDVIKKIVDMPSFKEYSAYFREREKMLPETYDVMRNKWFDMECLEGIASQKHLLNRDSRIILEMLLHGIQLTRIVPDCRVVEYFTSIESKYQSEMTNIVGSDHYSYQEGPEVFNISYYTIYRSVVKGPKDNWLLEHNDPLTEEEKKRIKEVFAVYNTESASSV